VEDHNLGYMSGGRLCCGRKYQFPTDEDKFPIYSQSADCYVNPTGLRSINHTGKRSTQSLNSKTSQKYRQESQAQTGSMHKQSTSRIPSLPYKPSLPPVVQVMAVN
jgi:hypothetical protein